MIMNAVECSLLADFERGHPAEHIVVNRPTLLGRQAIADRIVTLDRLDQPHAVIEALPE